MARSRDRRELPKQSGDKDKDDDMIIPEIVNPPPLVTPHIIEIYIKEDKQDDLERLLDAEVEYNRKRFAVIREHLVQHPDGIENRKTKAFRRVQYGILLGILGVLLLTMPYIPLSATAVFGVISILIVSGVLVNARERELDLKGFIKIITTIAGRQDK
jgi:hypothetical protein